MKLRRLHLPRYGRLSNVKLVFDQSEPYDDLNLRFFVGVNGSGKSTVLRAVGYILAHLAAGVPPDLDFELVYEVGSRGSEKVVLITNLRDQDKFPLLGNLKVAIRYRKRTQKGRRIYWKDTIEGNETDVRPMADGGILPNRIVASASGPASQLEEDIVNSVLRYTRSQVGEFDTNYESSGQTRRQWSETLSNAERDIEREVDKLLNNRYTFCLNANDALTATLALLAFYDPKDDQESSFSAGCRQIIKQADLYQPNQTESTHPLVSFTLQVSGSAYERLRAGWISSEPEPLKELLELATVQVPLDPPFSVDSLLAAEDRAEQAAAGENLGEQALPDFIAVFDLTDIQTKGWPQWVAPPSEAATQPEAISTQEEANPDAGSAAKPSAKEKSYITQPLRFFEHIHQWQRRGIITDVRLTLRKQFGGSSAEAETSELITERDLSDGEYLYIGRYALLLLMREVPDSLILLDEPDTHFNDQWKVDLVNEIVKLFRTRQRVDTTELRPGAYGNTELIIATHANLVLTDADHRQVYVFNPTPSANEQVVEQSPIELLAGDISQITTNLFDVDEPIGSYAQDLVNQALYGGRREKIERLLRRTGAGYSRFRLRERLLLMDKPAKK